MDIKTCELSLETEEYSTYILPDIILILIFLESTSDPVVSVLTFVPRVLLFVPPFLLRFSH